MSRDHTEPADPAQARPEDVRADMPAPRRRRGYRRATGGTAPAGTEATPGRAPDDTDLGWNEPSGNDDDRILREKPPHW